MSIENPSPREIYEKKEAEGKDHEGKAALAGFSLENYGHLLDPDQAMDFAVTATESRQKFEWIQQELSKMRDVAEGEASELHKEYKRLVGDVNTSLEELEKFQTEKLGMQVGKSEMQN